MRLSIIAASALGLVFSWGCKPPPKEVTEARFKSEVRRYFSNLNSENEMRRESLRRDLQRAEENPVYQPPTGMMINTYVFDPEAFMVTGFKCRACAVKLMVLIPSLEYLCPSCRHSPYLEHAKGTDLRKSPCTQCVGPDHKPKPPDEQVIQRKKFEDLKGEGVAVKDMFEIVESEPAKPMKVNVRYIRRAWAWDRRATVQVSPKAVEKAASSLGWIPAADGVDAHNKPGFHRLDDSWMGEVQFQLKGEDLVKLSGPVEEPLRLWKDLKTIK